MKKILLSLSLISLIQIGNAQITLVSDFNPNIDNTDPMNPVPLGSDPEDFFISSANVLYLSADNGTQGTELYTFDGTNFTLVKDINTDPNFASGSSNPDDFIEFNGMIYFNGSDGDEGVSGDETELWVTDGTEAGTNLVADINMNASANPQDFFIYNNELYFEANDGPSVQIWALNNGSPVKITNNRGGGFAVVSAVAEISAGVVIKMLGNNGANPHLFDGTAATELVDATAGNDFFVFNDEVYFEADPGDGTGDELWKTDGTTAGTVMVKDIYVGGNSDPREYLEFNGEIFFAAEDADGYNLWKSDGTDAGTVLVSNPNAAGNSRVGDLFTDGTTLYFSADDGTNGVELWKYDGTTASMVKDINTGGNSNPDSFVMAGGFLFFAADDGTGNKLWMTDGTEAGTVSVASTFATSEDPIITGDLKSVEYNGIFYFQGDAGMGDELYSLDPTTLSVSNVLTTTDKLSIYPNPSRGEFYVKGVESGEYTLYNTAGKLVSKGAFEEGKAFSENLVPGVYILQISSESGVSSHKIMIK